MRNYIIVLVIFLMVLLVVGTASATDTTAPTATAGSPARNAENVPVDTQINTTFSEPIKEGTMFIELKNSAGNIIPTTSAITSSNVVTVTPTTQLTAATTYNIILHTGSITDLAGNPLALYSRPFTTTTYVGSFSINQTLDAATWVKNYVETNNKLPDKVTITGTNLGGVIKTTEISLPAFLKLITTVTRKIYDDDFSSTELLEIYGSPTGPSETIPAGDIPLLQYITMAGTVKGYMDDNRIAPNCSSHSGLGTQFGYQNLLYTFSRILNAYKINGTLPASIAVDQWKGVFNNRTNKTYVCIQDAISDNETLNGDTIFVGFGKYTENIIVNKKLNIIAQNSKNVIIHAASSSNPIFKIISTGSGSTIERFIIKGATNSCGIYLDENTLNCTLRGNNITDNKYGVNVWHADNNTIELNDICDNSYKGITVNNGDNNKIRDNLIKNNADYGIYLGTCHNISITGNSIYGPGLHGINPQASTATINYNIIDGFSKFGIVVQYSSCVVNATNNYYGTNSPKYVKSTTWPSSADIYVEAGSATYNPWCSYGTELSRMNIIQQAIYLKNFIETNHQLPISITVAGTMVSMPQFLYLLTQTVLDIKNNTQTTNFSLKFFFYRPITTQEQITEGIIPVSEYLSMANTLKSVMDECKYAPNYMLLNISDGYMGFESLVYMYSEILSTYNNNQTLPTYVTVKPWLAVINPNMTYNFKTNKAFTSIQSAIDDTETENGDTITLGKLTYTENVVLNKKVAIVSLFDNTTIIAFDQYLPVFTILFNGSGSFIENLNIKGSIGNAGILLNNSSNNTITKNNITENSNGISLLNSSGNNIFANHVYTNNMSGIIVNEGGDNEFSSNNIINNTNGISMYNSTNCTIYSNNIANNSMYGIYLYNSPTLVNFNRISMNNIHGLYNIGNGTVNAQNNWWGSNTPNMSLNTTSDICIDGDAINCTEWLVLSVISSIDRSNRTGSSYNNIITTDLTHNNNGDDTSQNGDTVPDGIIISTNMVTVTTSSKTKKGKATAIISNPPIGMVNILTVLDRQTINNTVNNLNINLLAIHNIRTGEGFTSIQSAINDSNTIDGDIITLDYGTYTENILVNKNITIKAVTGNDVTVRPADINKPVFIITESGSGSKINGLKIFDALNSYAVALTSASNCNITGNIIEGHNRGIYFYLSNNNTIYGNRLYDNYYGVCLYNSTNNIISGNNISNSYYGAYLLNSNSTTITGNTVSDNWDGIHLHNSSSINISHNTVQGNWIGIYIYHSNSTIIFGNLIDENGGGISCCDSNNTNMLENNVNDNWLADMSQSDSSKIVIATTIYTCGPAALATVLKTFGVNATEEELAELTCTSETGTSMLKLAQVARKYGLIAEGYQLNWEELNTNYIVVLEIDGIYHYVILKNITNTTVYFIDPNLGEIEMSLDKFKELYTGYALVISNDTILINDSKKLTIEEMDTINGMSIFSWAAKAVTKTWNKVVSTVKKTVKRVFSTVKRVVRQVIRIAAPVVKKVVSKVKKVVSKVNAVSKAVTKVINSINLNQCVEKAINDIKPSDEHMWMYKASYHEFKGNKFFGYHGYGGNEKNYGWYHFTVSRNKYTTGLWVTECDLLYKYNGEYYRQTQDWVMMPDPLNICQGNSHTFKFETPIYENGPDYYSQHCTISTTEIPMNPIQSFVVSSNITFWDVHDIGEVQ